VEFSNWQQLGDYGGSIAAVVVIMRFVNINNKWLYWLVSLVVVELADVFAERATTANSLVLAFLSSFGVALAAMGVDSLKK
jgi:hypothetical protein